MYVQKEIEERGVKMAVTRTAKTSRINLRASREQEDLLRNVAQRKGRTMTDFIIESACEAAEQELANEKYFRLSMAQWNAFIEALDRPAQVHQSLRQLFAEPGVLETERSKN
jgi:uncharacterized protein (DUF1778 family)